MKTTLLSWFENLVTKIAVMRTLLTIQADEANLRSNREEADITAFRGPFF